MKKKRGREPMEAGQAVWTPHQRAGRGRQARRRRGLSGLRARPVARRRFVCRAHRDRRQRNYCPADCARGRRPGADPRRRRLCDHHSVIPTIVIVGRPNVGKSTLFNRFTRSRDALVADVPGLTRDRHYGRGRVGDKSYLVVDTGGLEPVAHEGILHAMAQQTLLAVDEADAVVLLVDGRQGLTPQDRTIAGQLRKTGRRIWLVVNKAEGMQPATVNAEFHELALGDPLAISAAHGDGVSDLADLITADFAVREEPDADAEAAPETRPRIAIVGRPNVGKSTLVNSLLGEERVLVFDQPGTTRDSIYIDFEREGRRYTLIDTAGMRRRGNIADVVEKFSVIKTLQAIEDANVVILVLDAREPITDQDAHIAGFILEAGRALVVAVNKWDGLKSEERDWTKRSLARTLNFIEFAPAHYISALA